MIQITDFVILCFMEKRKSYRYEQHEVEQIMTLTLIISLKHSLNVIISKIVTTITDMGDASK